MSQEAHASPARSAREGLLHRAAARLGPYVPALAVSAVLGAYCIRGILHAAGGPAAPLDDAFIHLTFARRLAEGHFFSYVPGEGYSSGATSLIWPILLAPFHALGLRGTGLLWASWLFGGLAHAALAVEVFRVTRRLAGRAAAWGSAAMSALFPAFAWFAWSGMETMALAWIVLRGARLAAAYAEPEEGTDPPSIRALLAAAILAPLIRPEGALVSLLVAVALALRPPEGARARRFLALAPLVGPLIVPLVNLVGAGHAGSATAQVKWAIGNPYYSAATVVALTAYNARVLVTSLLNGGEWTWIFLPEHASIPLLLGAIALPIAGARRKLPLHALFVGLVALGALAPCTYLSFLWNRIRYVWPFAGALFVLVGCLAREIGDLLRRLSPRLGFVTPLIAGACAGCLAMRLPVAVRDLAQSASAIDKQQVTLGRWAKANLPADARVGVNDTGAIAYLSERRTFDVVGLTTEGEARHWVAGAGSRFEHYEKSPRDRLPTHFIVYPQWMACPPVLGRVLTEATVIEQSILGGPTMVAYEARWDLLGSGASPAHPPEGLVLADEVDVSDVESETAHSFELKQSWDVDNHVRMALLGGRLVADGGRVNRARDAFRVAWPAGKPATLVMRVDAEWPMDLAVEASGRALGAITLPGDGTFADHSLALPADLGGKPIELTITARGQAAAGEPAHFGSFHYWVYSAP
ncbi:Hypothetical protein A7982_07001 [Minicystis rosea]|nr:Hypothetical protein A7982_07001 [Minicystis rosea]